MIDTGVFGGGGGNWIFNQFQGVLYFSNLKNYSKLLSLFSDIHIRNISLYVDGIEV